MSEQEESKKQLQESGAYRGTKRFLSIGGGVTILLIVSLTYLLVLGQQISLRLSPLLNASLQARHEVTLGHLWLEELLAGDSLETIDTVIDHFAYAQDELVSILDGTADEGSWSDNPRDDQIHLLVVGLLAKIPELQSLALYRQSLMIVNGTGFQGREDGEFDTLFTSYLRDVEILQEGIQKKIRSGQAKLEALAFTMMLLVVVALVSLVVMLVKWERQREQHIDEIENANEKIGEKNDQLESQAHFDYLTGLPNRALFRDRVIQALGQIDRSHEQLVLLFVDLDRFKMVNDTKGHKAGDELLTEVAKRITEQVRTCDTVARLAGDEFAILLQGLSSRIDAVTSSRAIASKIVMALKMPYSLKQGTANISASIGISIAPEDGKDCETLLSNADRAMYHAKTMGRNNSQFYSHALNLEATRHEQRRMWVRNAVSNHELFIEYQSKWHLQTGKMVGVEANVGSLLNDEVVKDQEQLMLLADEAGVVENLSGWALHSVLETYSQWREKGLSPGRLSFHLSVSQFRHPDLIEILDGAFVRFGVDPKDVLVQVAESTITSDFQFTRQVLIRLKTLGVRLSVNDVGKSYTTMRYLDDLPLDGIKLHSGLIQAIGFDPVQQESLDHFINLARLMSFEILADGVETEEQERYLKSKGEVNVQGIRFGRPVDARKMRYMMSSRQEADGKIVRFVAS